MRSLIRVKMADDADLDQAMQGACRVRDFLIHVYHHAKRLKIKPFEMLQELEP